MSAWIVSKKHIDALVTWATKNNIVVTHKGALHPISGNLDDIGQSLWRENFRSVNSRYSENKRTPKYIFQPEHATDMVIYKNIGCYDYQTCEHAGYKDSFAFAFVEAVMKKLDEKGYNHSRIKMITYLSNQYENASWGID